MRSRPLVSKHDLFDCAALMNFRDLDYICAVAEHKHFGKASIACNVSQPTLSGQIKKLEDRLGVTLFERSHKGIRVTSIGQEIIAIAREARAAADRIKSVASLAQNPFAGRLSLGIIPTIAPFLIPRFVKNIGVELPDLSITYIEDITPRLNEALSSGTLDAAILATAPEEDMLTAIEIYSEPFWVVLPDGHPLNTLETPSMDDIDPEELLLLTEGHCFRDQALSICRPAQTRRAHSLRATGLETLINLVAAGQGVTLVPALALGKGSLNQPGLLVKKLKDKGAARTIYLTYRKSFPQQEAVQALVKTIRSGLPETVTILKGQI